MLLNIFFSCIFAKLDAHFCSCGEWACSANYDSSAADCSAAPAAFEGLLTVRLCVFFWATYGLEEKPHSLGNIPLMKVITFPLTPLD